MTESTGSTENAGTAGNAAGTAGSGLTLTPPGTGVDGLTLTPPAPVTAVPAQQAADMLPLPEERRAELTAKARDFAAELASMDPRTPDFTRRVDDIASMGDGEIRSASQVAGRMLGRPVAALSAGGGEGADAQARVAGRLVELRRTVVDLDPKQAAGGPRRLLGLIPFGDRLRDYFAGYASAQRHIDDIVRALKSGQDELLKDNAAIEGEKANLWEAMTRLQEYAVLAAALDAAIEERLLHLEAADPERATALRSDALFAVRQKHQDILTQLAVSVQGYLALDLVRKNNRELIKGVDRATTTTVAALRTAVIVAQALANQKLVLDQITALNTMTGDLILATGEMLRTQAGAIQNRAAATTVDMDTLRRAFDDVYATMDMIDSFRAQAVRNMAVTVESLTVELEHARTYVERAASRAVEQPEPGR
ncbi:toxic anion resistance protein [Planomonospora parontospora]|uniref:toxic anion resistance protein n=1 Tax=Planomonospora parontospora TaxID=58119 RepID=UPI0019B2D5DB|nr:toxic anion resistance protein [Planomonospora parontospora]GGL25423.1 toxic anion resistance protein [Planomonospora parontospora subsp. antibiotica]GII16339.1 toxic anion resistance protein [Planomonospora parontospora subsp. antibiotica]